MPSPRPLSALAALCFTAAAHADLLPIINPGFEQVSVTLRPGEQTSAMGGGPPGFPVTPVATRWVHPFQQGALTPQTGVLVPGWRTANPATSHAGVLNPAFTFNDIPWLTGYSGVHVATAQASFAQQTLDVQLQPATAYTLSFLAGIGITDSSYSPFVQLLAAPDLTTFATPGVASVRLLAANPVGKISAPDFGVMHPFSFSYTSPAVLPPDLAGRYLAISFIGSDGIPRMNFDDFRLDATAVPAPGAAACVLLIAASRTRRRPLTPPRSP